MTATVRISRRLHGRRDAHVDQPVGDDHVRGAHKETPHGGLALNVIEC